MACDCSAGFVHPFDQQDDPALDPGDYEGSPCREAMHGKLEAAYAQFKQDIASCPVDPNCSDCVDVECMMTKYLSYLQAWLKAVEEYHACVKSG